MKRFPGVFIAFLSLLILLLAGCNSEEQFAGTGSHGEGIVVGKAAYADSSPAANASLHVVTRLFPTVESLDSASIRNPLIFDTTTAPDGSFSIPELPTGDYLIEINDRKGFAVARKFQILRVDLQEHLNTVVLQPIGVLTGKIALPDSLIAGTTLLLDGTNRTISLSSKLEFSFHDLPAGEYDVVIKSDSARAVQVALRNVKIESDDTTSLDNIRIDSLAVVHILERNYLSLNTVPVSSVISRDPLTGRIASLNVAFLGLSTLPPVIKNLTALTRLDLRNNLITELPDGIGALTHLVILDASGNLLRTLPAEISKCNSLQHVFLTDNRLEYLPDEIADLSSLKTIDISNNKIVSLPVSISRLKSVRFLYANKCHLTAISPEISALTDLTVLELSGNKISFIDAAIGNLRALTTLDLSNNFLVALPESISSLASISHLWLNNNLLTALPEGITALKPTNLDLSKNKLHSLPDSIKIWADRYNPGWEMMQY